MAKEPIISWVDTKTMKEFGSEGAPASMRFSSSKEKYQSILTGMDSVPLEFCICNNFKKGESTTDECYDLVDCRLVVKSSTGDYNSPIVTEKWIRAKCESSEDTEFKTIGATLSGDSYTEESLDVSSSKETAKTISGKANDGDETSGAKYNVAKITAIMNPPRTTKAPATSNMGIFRLIYSYGEGIGTEE